MQILFVSIHHVSCFAFLIEKQKKDRMGFVFYRDFLNYIVSYLLVCLFYLIFPL